MNQDLRRFSKNKYIFLTQKFLRRDKDRYLFCDELNGFLYFKEYKLIVNLKVSHMVLDFIRNQKYFMIVRTSYTTPASYVKLSIGTPKPGKCELN